MIEQSPMNQWVARYWEAWYTLADGKADIDTVYEDAMVRWQTQGERDPAAVAREDWRYATTPD